MFFLTRMGLGSLPRSRAGPGSVRSGLRVCGRPVGPWSEVNPRCVGLQNTCKRDHEEQDTKQKRNYFPKKNQPNKQTSKTNKQNNKQTTKLNKQTNKQKIKQKSKTSFSLPGVCCLKDHPSTGERLILERSWSEKSKNRVLLGFFDRWGSIKRIKTTRDHWLDQVNIPIQFLMPHII